MPLMAFELYVVRRKSMLHNLKAEMARSGIKNSDIAKAIAVNERSIRNKIMGATQFTFKETRKIRDTFFPNMSFEYLFEEDSRVEDDKDGCN